MNYLEHTIKDRRLVMLRILSEQTHYHANDAVLQKLLKVWAHAAPQAEILADCKFLESNGLVVLSTLGEYTIAELTNKGLEVAQGTALCEGVSRPSPRRAEK